MAWTHKFSSPLALNDGRAIATLADARQLMLDLSERHTRNAHWQYAGELLLAAARKPSAIPEADKQLRVALKAEGLL